MDFIKYVRDTMEWGERKLSDKEVETMFAILNETHDKIVRHLRQIINDFSQRSYNDNPYLQAEQTAFKKERAAKKNKEETDKDQHVIEETEISSIKVTSGNKPSKS